MGGSALLSGFANTCEFFLLLSEGRYFPGEGFVTFEILR